MTNRTDRLSRFLNTPASSRTIHILVGLFAVCFLFSACRAARVQPLWQDEVLSVWAIRLPSIADVQYALYHGSEFAPPTYNVFLHLLGRVAGYSYLVLRLPSILAILISGLCVLAILRRHLGLAPAALGMAFALLGILWTYGLLIRPYAMVTGCFALALFFWDGMDDRLRDLWRIVPLSLALALAASLHFYGVLFVPCVGLIELLWSAVHRRLRPAVWLGLLLAGLSCLIWLPLIHVLSRFNANDASSPGYYASPLFWRLTDVYSSSLIASRDQILLLTITICLAGAAYLFGPPALRPGLNAEVSASDESHSEPPRNLFILSIGAAAFPIIVFLFALVVTKTFNVRYCFEGSLGLSCLVAWALSRISSLKTVVTAVMLAACVLMLKEVFPRDLPSLTLVAKAANSEPIAVENGRTYFELEEAAPKDIASRLVFVTVPPGVINPDPTNENQVKRWGNLRPDLKIMDLPTLLAQSPHFCTLQMGDLGPVNQWLISHGLVRRSVASTSAGWVGEVDSPQ